MKLKKFLACLLSIVMLASCTAAFAATYTPGTYTVTAAGRNGDMVIDVTFTEDAIANVVVVSRVETAGIADVPVVNIPAAITANPSLAVDAIAGATITCDAIIAGVTEAVVQAGGDPAVLQTTVEKTVSTEVVEQSTEVVVVGAGAAGMSAAIRLANEGHQVLLLEKMSFPGGATNAAGGGLAVCDTQELRDMGEHTDPEVLFTYVAESGGNVNNPDLTKIFAYEIGDAIDYLRNEGVGINYANSSGHTNPAYARHSAEGGGAGLISTMNEIIASKENVDFRLNMNVKELLVDETGAVTGVKTIGADGTTYIISTEAVVLATGTYSGNMDVIGEHYMTGTFNTAPNYLTGDGLLMAMEIGAQANHLERVPA